MIKLIIFDIGGVIINFSEEKYIKYIAKKRRVDWRKMKKFMFPLIAKMELRKIMLKQVEEAVSKRFQLKGANLEWDSAYRKMANLNLEVKNILQKLSKKYTIVLLTNVSISRLDLSKKLTKGLNFKKIYASCYLGLRKPDTRIYKYVLKDMKVKPSEAIFIDNQIENVIGSRKVNIKSIWFRNANQLTKEIKKLNLV